LSDSFAENRVRTIVGKSARDSAEQLRRQNHVLVDLAKRRSIHSGDLIQAVHDITEASAAMLDVDRVGIWFYNADRQCLRCVDLFDRAAGAHTAGLELSSSNQPAYFRALETERTIAVEDIVSDPRTRASVEDYHDKRGILSLLDAPIRHKGQMVGVISHESVSVRSWTIEEENFAGSMADLAAMALDAGERAQTEEKLRHRVEFERLISAISTHFINLAAAEVDLGINDTLRTVGRYTAADRAYVMLLDPDGRSGSLAYEWCAEGITPRRPHLKNVPVENYPWWMERLQRFEGINVPRVSDLPPEAWREQKLHEADGNRSVVSVPLVFNRALIGFVGLNSTTREHAWTEETIALLKIVGEIFVSALERRRAERALLESERRHRLLFERNLAGVYRNTIDGRILDCNEALARSLGYDSREEFMQKNAEELYFDPAERAQLIDYLRKHRTLSSAETRLRKKDGTPVWLLENVTLLGGGIEPEILEGTLIDISDRKLAEDALRESERRYRLLVERMREGLMQVSNSGVIELVNHRFCDMVGYSREELVGRQASDLLVDARDRELLRQQISLRQLGASDQYELKVRRADGEIIWLEIGGAPVFDAAGNVIGSIGVHNDITVRKRAEAALRESEALYRLMAENTTDLISRHAPDGVSLYVSPACMALLGYEQTDMIGRTAYSFIHRADRRAVREAHEKALQDNAPVTVSFRIRRKDGAYVWFESTSRAVHGLTDDVREIVAVSRDVSERKHAEARIEYQAYHDSLTGLPNRLLFKERLTVALAHARRQRRPLAVMFLDIDRFKLVNDTLGHSAGDQLLRIIATRLLGALREEDTIARMGGDEFTVLISRLSGGDDAARIATKILDTIAQPISIDGQELFLTTSIGIALCPNDGENAEILLRNADNAMYRAKEMGRNSYQLCAPAMNIRALERLALENSLRRAVERNELVLHYQPQIDLRSRSIIGVEALLRWNHPERGLIMPGTFIPIAEETRMIVPIGEWVLREACRQARKWQQTHYPGLRVAVNLSPRQFQQPDLKRVIASALSDAGLDACYLELEITEGTAMQNTDRTVATLQGLRELGVSISIDDFGTGHSSLSYLRSFPIDGVKIDQTFVHEIEASRSDRAILSAVIAMAHGLNLRVIAEGVETEAQVDFLHAEGCDEVQGFLFSPGKPVDQLTNQ
jgi:diguanylate cyclase (GGDEF)-like protein/PAS domain S-box-containing protein